MKRLSLSHRTAYPRSDIGAIVSNHISEGEFDCITREDAIEAVAYWREFVEAQQQKLNELSPHIIQMSLGAVRIASQDASHMVEKALARRKRRNGEKKS